jgi:hypothetical protein
MDDSQELSREELVLLLNMAGELAAQSDQDKLVRTILEKACRMTGSPDGSVLLYDPEHRGLFFAASVGAKSASCCKSGESNPASAFPWTAMPAALSPPERLITGPKRAITQASTSRPARPQRTSSRSLCASAARALAFSRY